MIEKLTTFPRNFLQIYIIILLKNLIYLYICLTYHTLIISWFYKSLDEIKFFVKLYIIFIYNATRKTKQLKPVIIFMNYSCIQFVKIWIGDCRKRTELIWHFFYFNMLHFWLSLNKTRSIIFFVFKNFKLILTSYSTVSIVYFRY